MGPAPLIVAGRGSERAVPRHDIPVLADPRTVFGGHPAVIAHADPILRSPVAAAALRPTTVLRVGDPPASRVVNEWLASCGAATVVADAWTDPTHTMAAILDSMPEFAAIRVDETWLARWRAADDAAESAIESVLAGYDEPTEPGIARDVVTSLPTGAHLVLASSMPIRDVEWYAPRRSDITVHANRGANGIDGTISTAIGVALASGAPTTALLGDIAFLHDSSALTGIRQRDIDLRLVVIDNDGGGIFSFLPQASALDGDQFERVFGTPHGVDIAALAAVHGARVEVIKTNRVTNVRVHNELNAAVGTAVEAALRAHEG